MKEHQRSCCFIHKSCHVASDDRCKTIHSSLAYHWQLALELLRTSNKRCLKFLERKTRCHLNSLKFATGTNLQTSIMTATIYKTLIQYYGCSSPYIYLTYKNIKSSSGRPPMYLGDKDEVVKNNQW